ncbi:hypothetical protein [uncultured Arthrobacter sp.]|nr:hypothetical protein [uncultured Arthrobacter sp.]
MTITNGISAASFRYGDTKAGTPTLTASSTGLTAAPRRQPLPPAQRRSSL